MPIQIWEFSGSLSPFPGLSTFGWPYTSLCPCVHKAGIIWNIATCEQCTLKVKEQILLSIKFCCSYSCLKMRQKTFEWRQYLKWCHYITFHTFSIEYTQNESVIYRLPNYLSKFHKDGCYNFFSKRTSTFR